LGKHTLSNTRTGKR